MSDYLISVVDATSAFPTPKENREYQTSNLDDAYDKGWDDCQLYIGALPPIDAVQVVRCKDCKHRPKRLEEGGGEGFNLEFPDYKCPCQCDDGWYNWMPDDNWFCGNAERKEK